MNKYDRMYRITIRLDTDTELIFVSGARNMELAAQVAQRYAAIAYIEEDCNAARVVKIEEIRG